MGLGDAVQKALASVGVTSERVEAWLGRQCRCKERQARLNALGSWAVGVLRGQKPPDEAKKDLDEMVRPEEEKPKA